MRNYMADLPYYDVCYCRYGYDYKKPTRIWTNLENFKPLYCNHKGRHKEGIGLGRTGAKVAPPDKWKAQIGVKNVTRKADRYSIPPPLIEDLLLQVIYEM